MEESNWLTYLDVEELLLFCPDGVQPLIENLLDVAKSLTYLGLPVNMILVSRIPANRLLQLPQLL